VDDHLVPAALLAQLDPSVLEQLAHLVVVSPGVQLDLRGGRPGRGLELDTAFRQPDVEGDLARRLE